MRKISLLLFFIHFLINGQYAQICDSLVPTFIVDFTGGAAGSTWTSPDTSKAGNCCSSIAVERCIDFVIHTDSNTRAVTISIPSGGLPPGTLYCQLDCGPLIPISDTVEVNICGIHCLTFCKPGNNINTYSIKSILSSNPSCNGISTINCNNFSSAVHERNIEREIFFYPNPLTSSSTLQLSTHLKDAEVIIYDMLGKEMMRKKLSGDRMEIERGSLVSGVYFVRVREGERQWVEKVVME